MADQNQLEILGKGVDEWNAWRVKHPMTMIDLSGIDFKSKALNGINLSGANLSRSDFREALLSGAKLRGVNLAEADLRECVLYGADLSKSNLRGAKLIRAILTNVNFSRSFLGGAHFDDSILGGADFSGALFSGTRFSSKSSLNSLAIPLKRNQLFGCIFIRDEQSRENRKKNIAKNGPDEYLDFIIDGGEWSPADLAMLLMAMQLTVNRIQYLITTFDDNIEILESNLDGWCYPERESESIRLRSISLNSPLEIVLEYIVRDLFFMTNAGIVITYLATFLGACYGSAKVFESVQSGLEKKAKARLLNAEAAQKEHKLEQTRSDLALLNGGVPQAWLNISTDDDARLQIALKSLERPNLSNDVVEKYWDSLILRAGRTTLPVKAWMDRADMRCTASVKSKKAKSKGRREN